MLQKCSTKNRNEYSNNTDVNDIENNNRNDYLSENIDLQDEKLDSIDALVKINIFKNRYSSEYFYISPNCTHI